MSGGAGIGPRAWTRLAAAGWLAVAVGSASGAAAAAPQGRPGTAEAVAARLGAQVVRGVASDICLPADAAEYEAMGKNAIVRLEASTAISTELPLRAAYVTVAGVRVPLQRVAALPARTSGERAVQVSFYMLPVHVMKGDGRLQADFTGGRTGFGVSIFPSSAGAMPAFARLDEYD